MCIWFPERPVMSRGPKKANKLELAALIFRCKSEDQQLYSNTFKSELPKQVLWSDYYSHNQFF